MEKQKYAKCPVKPDMVPGYVDAQGWGYVVIGYFLLEQALKLLLHLKGKPSVRIHYLFSLFDSLPQEEKDLLRDYYRDFKSSFTSSRPFPFAELDDFIINLDGDKKGKDSKRSDRHVGSFDWRYFPIEEMQGGRMPVVSAEFLHEVVYGVVRVIEDDVHGKSEASESTYSWRMHFERKDKYRDWLTVRRKSDGWETLGDRLEIVWGPDYQGRHDFVVFRGNRMGIFFSMIPDDHGLLVRDMRAEVDAFSAEEGFRSIGVTRRTRFLAPQNS